MKLGIDISQIVYEGTGVARFTEGLVKAIVNYDKENQWFFFFSGFRKTLDPKVKRLIIKSRHKLVEWSFPPKALSLLWNDWHNISIVPKELRGLDLFITSDWTEPKIPGVRKATIVHDLVFKRFPETVEKTILKTQTKRLRRVSKESDLIFTDSQATKDDLLKYYAIEKDKVVVNYPGVEVSKAFKKDTPKRPFVLTVGKLEPRKNLERLVKAFNKMNDESVELLIVGPKGWQNLGDEFDRPNIKILEFVSDQELYSLYNNCLFFIYPSIWEGFGIPVIEAMKLGAAVACSNTSSIKEIAGSAALTFNPLDVDEILTAMVKLKEDKELRKDLSKKGLLASAKFTWKNYYDKMMKSIYENRH
jgi:glycosyltransferase involved in cell wall biosynthesis